MKKQALALGLVVCVLLAQSAPALAAVRADNSSVFASSAASAPGASGSCDGAYLVP